MDDIKVGDPTEEQIRLACLEIQKSWSSRQEYSHCVTKVDPYKVQIIKTNELNINDG